MAANILVFGASTTYGAWDPEGGWVARLRKFIDQKVIASERDFYCTVYNLGVSGDSSEDLLERFEFETKQRIWEGEETIFIISLAINDGLFNNETQTLKVPHEKYKNNVKELINIARKYGTKIILVGGLPVDENKVDPIPWMTASSYKNKFRKEYEEIMENVAKEEGVYFVDIYQKTINNNYQKLLEDGVHPNSEGHQVIFEEVKKDLLDNNIISD